jgi:Tol biopolymer transport system component
MPLAEGARVGAFEILAQLGSGGMGEVYRARDTRLDRTVALKVIRAAELPGRDRLERFRREARAISRLNHPNICALHDIGEEDGETFLVMEYVHGETLADRLVRGPLKLEEVLRFGAQIAEALAAAHHEGVVHRDLKPGNIMLAREGVKLLDFGLAKLRADGDGATDPTMSLDVSDDGVIIGTLPYMAPEQLEGKPVDARTDLFALGAVLYEMSAGEPPFKGTSKASLIVAILSAEPVPITTHQPLIPPLFDRVIHRCLAKTPDERWQTATDLRAELMYILEPVHSRLPAAAQRRRFARRMALWSFAPAAALVATALAWRSWGTEPVAAPQIRFAIQAPDGVTLAAIGASVPSAQLAISPDGRLVAFVASRAGSRPMLWLRPSDGLQPRPIAGTEDAAHPFWSPDSESIAYFGGGKLKRLDLPAGPPRALCDSALNSRGGTWSADGTILFSPNPASGLMRVSAAGGQPRETLPLKEGDTSYRWPSFLPDGRSFLFYSRGPAGRRGIYLGSLDSTATTRLLETAGNGIYAPPGRLLTVQGGALLAYPFDLSARRIVGVPVQIADGVGASSTNFGAFSSSSTGMLVYGPSLAVASQLTWFDRSGNRVGEVMERGDYVHFSLAPDDARLIVSRTNVSTDTPDLWVMDLARRVPNRFTFDAANDTSPVWSPSGSRIVFRSDRHGGNFIYEASSSNDQSAARLSMADAIRPTDWSPDGRFLVYHTSSASTGSFDIMLLSMADKTITPLAQTPFNEIDASFSPDGRFIAYASDESGPLQVYVQPFPPTGVRWLISDAGGSEPRWRKDGNELFYVSLDRKLMSVVLEHADPSHAAAPRALFGANFASAANPFRGSYDNTADGQRFLVNVLPTDSAALPPLTVIVNWPASLVRAAR